MDDFQIRAAALATLTEHMQEKAVEFLLEQGVPCITSRTDLCSFMNFNDS
jgi:hypothetical protein